MTQDEALALFKERNESRRNFINADRIREILRKEGFDIEDTQTESILKIPKKPTQYEKVIRCNNSFYDWELWSEELRREYCNLYHSANMSNMWDFWSKINGFRNHKRE